MIGTVDHCRMKNFAGNHISTLYLVSYSCRGFPNCEIKFRKFSQQVFMDPVFGILIPKIVKGSSHLGMWP